MPKHLVSVQNKKCGSTVPPIGKILKNIRMGFREINCPKLKL
jgi:hypothetical protein